MQAAGSVLTNKYAEGYPGKRYYGGCEFVDVAEQIAIDRAKQLFGAEAANVQPHRVPSQHGGLLGQFDSRRCRSWTRPCQGGHLTHGMHLNISGKLYKFLAYGVDPVNHRIDFDQVAKLAREHKPKMIVAGASAYPVRSFTPSLRKSPKKLEPNSWWIWPTMLDWSPPVHDNPVPVADFVTTTTHKTLRGPRGGLILSRAEFAKPINSAVFPHSGWTSDAHHRRQSGLLR